MEFHTCTRKIQTGKQTPLCQPHPRLATTLLGFALMVTGCGGSSSSDTPQPDPIVLTTSTDDLKNSASTNIGSSLDTTLDGVARVTSGGVSSDGGQLDPTDTGVGQLWSDDAQSLIDTSLALGNDSNTVRDGTRITIDPDEAAVCSENLVDMAADDAEFQRCKSLVGDMIVQIDANTDTAGSMTYLFRSQPLAVIAYTATSNSIELNLGTLKTLIDADYELNPDANTDSPLDTIRGAIRLVANATNTTNGAEAGTVALEVSQPIAIASADAATTLSLGIGKIFGLTVDAASESATIELAVGALQASENDNGSVASIDMKGLTAIIETSNNSEQLVVRNLGIGQGPLKIALNNAEVANLGLDTFGFTASAVDGDITLDGALNLSVLVRELFDDNTVSDTLFSLLEMTAPAGTRLSEQLNGSLQVSSGGPLNYSLTTSDDSGSSTDEVTVNVGECADDAGDAKADLQIVSCQ